MATRKTMKATTQVPRPSAKAVVPAAPEARALSTGNWKERAAKSIQNSKKQVAKLPAANGNFLSFRGGKITLGGIEQQNPLPTVLLDYGYERTYYAKQYQPDVLSSPDCYSYDGVTPHEKSAVPQSEACANCPMNEFGSAQNGRGKACKEGARMVLMHADHAASPEQVLSAPLMQARASVLNSKVFRNYVENYFDAENRPVWSAVTTLSNQPDSKSQYLLGFEPSVLEADEPLLNALSVQVDKAEKMLVEPYPEIEEAPAPPPTQGAKRRKF